MSDQEIHEWVREKLDDGVSEERLKEVMINTGKDPSIVNEVTSNEADDSGEDPFQDSEVRPEPEEDNLFNSEDEDDSGNSGRDEGNDRSSRNSKETQDDSNSSFEGFSDTGNSGSEDKRTSSRSKLSTVKSKIPSLSVPRLSARKLLVPVLVLLIVGGGYMFYSTGSTSEDISEAASNFREPSVAPEHKGCPDVGVLIESISSSDGTTYADVNVARGEARVVLEIFSDGKKIGESRETIEGGASMEVDAVGDRAVFRPVDCDVYLSDKKY